MSNSAYYDQMYLTWGHHASRFQGKGFFISGKHSNWRQTCGALIRIVDFSKSMGPIETDSLVKKEIDALATAGNPSRGSWLTEMLCHYLPKRYPLLNRRTRKWLEHIEFRSPRSASEGSTYIDLAIKLRAALKENDYNEANDMAEIDGAISKWFELTF